ncbi:MAG: GNAT family N-acetyltransferase [Hyphomicrobiales bacterium]
MLPHRQVLVRDFEIRDADAASNVFYRAVHIGAKDFYDEAQRMAWAGGKPEPVSWQKRLEVQVVKVAELNSIVIGFMTLTKHGKIDLAFVAPEAMGMGIARKLYYAILVEAKRLGIKTLTTEASFLAQRFFKKYGWQTLQQQIVTRGSIELTNFLMKLEVSEIATNSGGDHSAKVANGVA